MGQLTVWLLSFSFELELALTRFIKIRNDWILAPGQISSMCNYNVRSTSIAYAHPLIKIQNIILHMYTTESKSIILG